MHFSLVKISPPGANPTYAFDDVILPMFFALKSLGFEAEIRLNDYNPAATNILFGSALTPRKADREAPAGSIVMNLEQAESTWFSKEYLSHLSKFQVWDYSLKNIAYLSGLGVQARHLPLGYVPEMTRIERRERDIDVLFYGFMSKRRLDILTQFGDIRVVAVQNSFGAERDRLLARARLLLNIHFYSPATLEVARLGYAWSNRVAVVSERAPDTELPPGLDDACLYCRYDGLVGGVRQLLENQKELEDLRERGFKAFTAILLRDALKKLVGERKASPKAGTGQGGLPCAATLPWLIDGPIT